MQDTMNELEDASVKITNRNHDSYPKEESALEWLQRVRSNKRRLLQNPIHFPNLSISSGGCNAEGTKKLENFEPYYFTVTNRSLATMASQTFLGRMRQFHELKTRSMRWRRRRMKERRTPTSRNGGNIDGVTSGTRTLDGMMAEVENALFQSFPKGTGVPFIDDILSSEPATSKSCNHHGMALEIVGRTGTAKTKLLMAMASNYVAATSVSCFGFMKTEMNVASAQNEDSYSQDPSAPDQNASPIVVLFDPEHSVDFDELIGFVRSAILQRWNRTSHFRRCVERVKSARLELRNPDDGTDGMIEESSNNDPENEYKTISQDIQNALGRIHVVRPKDILNGYVAALESLCQGLNRQVEADRKAVDNMGHLDAPPVMLLMDSVLSAFQLFNKMQESQPDGTGLSGRGDFFRLLSRLRSKHDVVLVSTNTVIGESQSLNESAWDKIITHRLLLKRSILGSPEQLNGNDFVGLYKVRKGSASDTRSCVVPFSVSPSGIQC